MKLTKAHSRSGNTLTFSIGPYRRKISFRSALLSEGSMLPSHRERVGTWAGIDAGEPLEDPTIFSDSRPLYDGASSELLLMLNGETP